MTPEHESRDQFRWAPVAAAWLFCCGVVALMIATAMKHTGNVFIYPLDDSYIHLALARTLAVSHVWGMDASGFASASSSPGWTLLLAMGSLLFGTHILTPVVLNLLFAFAILATVEYGFTILTPRVPAWARFLAMLLLILVTPLPDLVMLGMEHVVQTFSILLLLLLAARILSLAPADAVPSRLRAAILLTAALAGCIRYEAVFAILPLFALFLLRRRVSLAILVPLFSAIGPIGFALYSHHLSGFLLPFSVLTKAGQHEDLPKQLAFARDFFLGLNNSVLPFFLASILIYIARLKVRSFWNQIQLFLLMSLATATFQVFLGPLGWLMRYESYCTCLILFGMCLVAFELFFPLNHRQRHPLQLFNALPSGQKAFAGLILLTMLLPCYGMYKRGKQGIVLPVQASEDRFHEHIQMARFVASAYDHDTIVVNDIGAVAFFSHAHLLDLAGLGSAEPLLSRRRTGHFSAPDLARWAGSQQASIAILESEWKVAKRVLPPQWTLLEEWRIPRNVVFEGHTIGFYAVVPSAAAHLCSTLKGYPLPAGDAVVLDRCTNPNAPDPLTTASAH